MSGGAQVRAELEACLAAALAAVDAGAAVRKVMRRDGDCLEIAGRAVANRSELVVLAVGKAAAAMAAAAEGVAGDRIRTGLVITKAGHGLPLARLPLLEAGHPVPDEGSGDAADRALQLAAGVREQELFLLLLSGGASALVSRPLEGISPAELADTTAALLACGAEIQELNSVRKHLCALAGGRLARAVGASPIQVLVVSDVPGDRLDVIGSGPCHSDPSTFADALDVLRRRGIIGRVPRAVRRHLERGARGELEETPKPGDPALARVRTTIVARNRDARDAARETALRRGLRAVELGETLQGEARQRGRQLAALGCAVASQAPVLLIAGGESTVTLRGSGRGGRNQELALAAALALAGRRDVALLSAGSDGSDGPTDAAGAFVDGDTTARGAALGLDAASALADNDSYTFFDREGGLLRTGPTHTNVMDLVLVHCAGNAAGGRS